MGAIRWKTMSYQWHLVIKKGKSMQKVNEFEVAQGQRKW